MTTIKNSDIYNLQPPSDIEAEKAVLGALILEESAYEKIAGLLKEEYFYLDNHQIVYRAIVNLKKSSEVVDYVTIHDELKKDNLLDEIGGIGFILDLTAKVAGAAHIQTHARIIVEQFYKRKYLLLAQECAGLVANGEDVAVLGSYMQESLNTLEDVFAVGGKGNQIGEVLKDAVMKIQEDSLASNEKGIPGIPTNISTIDKNTGGWRKGNLNILAARTGVGKTSYALHCANQAAKAGFSVLFFTCEMDAVDLSRIMLSIDGEVSRSKIRDGKLDVEDWGSVNKTIGRLEELPIEFYNASGMNIAQINSIISQKSKSGHCDLVIVDYLQLVQPAKRHATREGEVAEISRSLQRIALKESISILALAQLNRQAEYELPRLSHIRESGSIEQDADMVSFLVPNGNKNELRYMVAKQRRGWSGDITIYCNEEKSKFSDSPF